MQFDENVFLWAMINRPYYCTMFINAWKAEWMKDATLIPLADTIFSLAKKLGTSPSIKTIKEYLVDTIGKELFEARYDAPLKELQELIPDDSYVNYTIDKARETAIVRSFENITNSLEFNKVKEETSGKKLLKEISEWVSSFLTSSDEETLPIDEAINKLIVEGSRVNREPISSGLVAIDDLTAGGLRAGQLGIFIAPTGQGKSTLLMNIAYRTSLMETCDTWFVSNELTMAEQTERFLGRMTGVSMREIQSNPIAVYDKDLLNKHWQEYKIQDRLVLTTILRPFSTKELEASLMKRKTITGWNPKLLVLDYIERLTPNTMYHGEQEWRTLGRVAADLIQFGKRHGIAIWTAAQTNRAGLKEGADLSMEMGQSSIRHFQEASYVFTLQKHAIPGEEENSDREAFKLRLEKARHSRNNRRSIYLEVDLNKMLVTDKIIDFELDMPAKFQPSKITQNGSASGNNVVRSKNSFTPIEKI